MARHCFDPLIEKIVAFEPALLKPRPQLAQGTVFGLSDGLSGNTKLGGNLLQRQAGFDLNAVSLPAPAGPPGHLEFGAGGTGGGVPPSQTIPAWRASSFIAAS